MVMPTQDQIQSELDRMIDNTQEDELASTHAEHEEQEKLREIPSAAPLENEEKMEEEADEASIEVEEEVKTESPEEVSELKTQIEALTQQLEALSRKTLELQALQTQRQQETQPMPDLATEDEYNEVLASHDGLNKFAKKIVSRTIEETLKRVEPLVKGISLRNIQEFNVLQEFFEANPDLKAHKTLLAVKATELRANNPGLTGDQIFKEAAKSVRSDLKKERQRTGTAPGGQPKPLSATVVPGTRSAPPKAATPEQKQLDEMLSIVLQS